MTVALLCSVASSALHLNASQVAANCALASSRVGARGDSADRYQVYSGEVRVGAIYRAHNTPGGDRWFWGLNGVQNGPGPFNGFVRTLDGA